jgi:hypothetical protein
MSDFEDFIPRGPGHTGQHPKRREDPAEPPQPEDEDEAGLLSSSAEENREVSIPLPGLVRARDLIASEDLDQGDFEPGGLYKGFQILPREQWPPESDLTPDPERGIVGHANQTRRFYVVSPLGTVGLVPWEGSQVVWPWEQAWRQDLYRPEVQTFLKDDREGKKK